MPHFKTYCYAWTHSNVAECVCCVRVCAGGGGEKKVFDICDLDQTLYPINAKDFIQHPKRYSPETITCQMI